MIHRKQFMIDIEPDEDFLKTVNNWIRDNCGDTNIMSINEYKSDDNGGWWYVTIWYY